MMTDPSLGRSSGRREDDATRLLARIAGARDRSAFAELFRVFAPRLKGFFRRRGVDDAESEELLQDVMLMVWRSAQSFDPAKAGASTWLYAIARNRWIDSRRRQARQPADTIDPLLSIEAEPLPDEAFDASQRDVRVREAMSGLPAAQLRLLRMSFFESKPHSEIAKELRIPLGTVKSRIRLAMGRLRRSLGDDG